MIPAEFPPSFCAGCPLYSVHVQVVDVLGDTCISSVDMRGAPRIMMDTALNFHASDSRVYNTEIINNLRIIIYYCLTS